MLALLQHSPSALKLKPLPNVITTQCQRRIIHGTHITALAAAALKDKNESKHLDMANLFMHLRFV